MKGYQGLFLRNVPEFAWFFMSYNILKGKFGVSEQDKVTEAYQNLSHMEQMLRLLFAGGLAGQFTWVICYPADFLKARL